MSALFQAEVVPPWHGGAPVDPSGRYLNLDGTKPNHGFLDFLKWRIFDAPKARKASKGEKPSPRVDNDGAFLRGNRTRATLTWIGHATILAQVSGVNILLDPNFSSTLGFFNNTRKVRPGVAFTDLPPIDVVVISHNHYDHLDTGTIERLPSPIPFLVPKGVGPFVRELGRDHCEEFDWGGKTEVKGVTFHFLPSQHWSRRGPFDGNATLWGSWLIEAGETKIFFAGDSGYFAEFARIGEFFQGITVAILPAGAYEPRWFMKDQHMNPEETLRAFLDLKADILVPIHWGTFKVTDEPMDEPPGRLLKGAEAAGISPDRIRVLKIGETLIVPSQ